MPTEAGVLLESTELLGPGYPELGSGAAGVHGAAGAAELKRPEGRARDRRLWNEPEEACAEATGDFLTTRPRGAKSNLFLHFCCFSKTPPASGHRTSQY